MIPPWYSICRCLGYVPRDIHVKNHLETCQKYTFMDPTPDLVNQKHGGGGPAIFALSFLLQANI